MKIHTIIVNYRTPDSTLRAIQAAAAGMEGTDDWRISVVDNASGDASAETIRSGVEGFAFRERVSVIESDHNGGFGYGNNLVLREALASDDDAADFFYLCNPDSYAEPGSITALAQYMTEHPKVGIAGSQLYGDAGEDCESAFRFHSLASEFDNGLQLGVVSTMLKRWRVALPLPCATGPVDWVSGASLMARRTLLDAVGIFDETFFLYFEETDLCHRANEAGWEVHHVAESRMHHIGGLSLGVEEPTARLPGCWFDSRRYYLLKHRGRFYTLVTNVAFAVGLLLRKLRHVIQRKKNRTADHLLGDFIRHSFSSNATRNG